MGKVFTFMSILIFVDLMFLITGQLTGTLTSIVFQAILDPALLINGTYWIQTIGDLLNPTTSPTGILSLLIGVGVTAGVVMSGMENLLYIPVALGFALLAGDFVAIYVILSVHSRILATIFIAPILLMFAFIILEWVRNKD